MDFNPPGKRPHGALKLRVTIDRKVVMKIKCKKDRAVQWKGDL